MRRLAAVVGSFVFLLIAPGTVGILVPWLISHWRVQTPLLHFAGFRIIGVLLIALGVAVILESFARFALKGLGTPAPPFPTQHLIVSGFYRYVRNPMYVGVASLIVGQGLLLGNARVLGYGVVVWFAFHVFVLVYEEPMLRRRFGVEYEVFCASVPRWIPRISSWQRKGLI